MPAYKQRARDNEQVKQTKAAAIDIRNPQSPAFKKINTAFNLSDEDLLGLLNSGQTPDQYFATLEASRQQARQRNRRGFLSTILTGPGGLLSENEGTVRRPSLLAS